MKGPFNLDPPPRIPSRIRCLSTWPCARSLPSLPSLAHCIAPHARAKWAPMAVNASTVDAATGSQSLRT